MLKYTIQRILLAFLTAFIILSITFILVKSLPIPQKVSSDDGVRWGYYMDQVNMGYFNVIIKPSAEHYVPKVNVIDNIVIGRDEYFFYQRPVLEQFFSWLKNIVTKWDWGKSTVLEFNASAIRMIGRRLPVSMSINFIAIAISIPLGIGLGIFAGLKKNTWIDHTISTLIMVFISIPSFVVISFLIYFLAYKTGWLPASWPGTDQSLQTKVLAYIIPVMSVSFGTVCGYARSVRAELCEVMSSEYLLLARTKGLTKNQAIVRHALRNAFVPILPGILASILGIFGASVILERLYGIPGIGGLYLDALNSTPRDYNVLMVDMAIFTTFGLLAGILFDLSYGFIDPRIRMGAKK